MEDCRFRSLSYSEMSGAMSAENGVGAAGVGLRINAATSSRSDHCLSDVSDARFPSTWRLIKSRTSPTPATVRLQSAVGAAWARWRSILRIGQRSDKYKRCRSLICSVESITRIPLQHELLHSVSCSFRALSFRAGSFLLIGMTGAGGLRQAIDTARDSLFELASRQLGVPTGQLMVQNGVFLINGGDSSIQVSYGQLLQGKRFNLTVNSKTIPKNPKDYTVLGTSVPRIDLPPKATGQFQYVQHVRRPGMLHGKVVRPPVVGARLVTIDRSSIAGMPGDVQIVVK